MSRPTSAAASTIVTAARPALLMAGVLLLALNLRPAAVSVGPVLTEVRAGLDLSTVAAGVLTSLPVLVFAVFGALAPAAAARLGLHRTILASLLVVSTGLIARSLLGDEVPFLVVTLLALAGMASLIRRHYPDRIAGPENVNCQPIRSGVDAPIVPPHARSRSA